MMEISTDIESIQPDYVSVDEMVEVEYIEVTEEENSTALDTIAASNYIDTSGEADNCSLFSPEPGDDVSSVSSSDSYFFKYCTAFAYLA